MKNLGRIEDPKDIITKEFLEGGIGARVNTLEDNLQMAESDIETLQTDVQGLKTDNTATKAAVKTLQDTYVPNTRKVNNKALDADITLTANDVGTVPAAWTKINDAQVDQLVISGSSLGGDVELGYLLSEDGYYYGDYKQNAYIRALYSGKIEVSAEPTTDMGIVNKKFLESKLDIFWAIFQVTTYQEVENALNAGKKVFFTSVDDNTLNGLLSFYEGEAFVFIAFKQKTMLLFFLDVNNVWTTDSISISPVTSVNNKIGAVTLSATDVGAITKVSPSTEGNLPILTTSGELTDSGKKISDIGGGVFLVTVTDDEASGYSADKTFIEIKNAYDAGMVVLLKYNGLIYHQITYTPNIFIFSYSNDQGTKTFAILSDNSVRSINTNFVPDTRTINNKPLSSNITLTASDVGAIPNTTSIPDIKVVTNVSCPLSAWVSDTTTYTDYQFKANLTVAGATADYIPLVNFAPSEQESGNYIGATSGDGIVTIWCKSKPSGTITIPNIILTKEN